MDETEYIFALRRISSYHACEKAYFIGYFYDKPTADRAAARIAFELGVSIQVVRIKMNTLSLGENISDTLTEFDEDGIRF